MLRNIHEEIRIISRAVIFIATFCAFMFNFVEYFCSCTPYFVVFVAFYAFFARSFRNISLALSCAWREMRQPLSIYAYIYIEYIYLSRYVLFCIYIYMWKCVCARLSTSTLSRRNYDFFLPKGIKLPFTGAAPYALVYGCMRISMYVCARVHFILLTTTDYASAQPLP